MQELITMLKNCKMSLEHPVYHPERYLGRHIALVTLKAMLLTNNIDLVLAGLFHDICKPLGGGFSPTEKGLFWRNTDHAKQAAELVLSNDEARYFVKSSGGSIDTVYGLCYYHMACKEKVVKKAKKVPFMDLFPVLDDMVNRKPHLANKAFDGFIPGFGLVKTSIEHVGQSDLQIHLLKNEFTVTLDRTPFRYRFEEIPSFFTGRYSFLKTYVNELL